MDCRGAELLVSVSDARGLRVADAVAIATVVGSVGQGDVARSAGAAQRPSGLVPPSPAVMDQINKAFVPAVLVVRTGTPVIFPNSDTIAHQVYSFSSAKRFELGLYRGHPHPPVVFDQPGLIVLGCNIHDNMAGYIVVTDSSYFGKSDDSGALRMSALPAAEYEVTVWHPQLPRGAAMIRQKVALTETQPGRAAFKLPLALRSNQETRTDPRMVEY